MKNEAIDLELEGIDDLKEKAFQTAKLMVEHEYNVLWLLKFSNRFKPSNHVNLLVKASWIYVQYLQKKATKEQSIKQINQVEDEFHNGSHAIIKAMSFDTAINKALMTLETGYGDVTFACPFCEGSAHATRYEPNGNMTVTLHVMGQCESCGYMVLD